MLWQQLCPAMLITTALGTCDLPIMFKLHSLCAFQIQEKLSTVSFKYLFYDLCKLFFFIFLCKLYTEGIFWLNGEVGFRDNNVYTT